MARKRSKHVPTKMLRWRERRRGRVMKRATFKSIARRAAHRYHSKARGRAAAGAAYWRALRANYARSHAKRNPSRARRLGRAAGRIAGRAYVRHVKRPVKRAIHRRLSALTAHFGENPQKRFSGYYVQVRKEGGWFTLAVFQSKERAIDYARALKRRHARARLRVFW